MKLKRIKIIYLLLILIIFFFIPYYVILNEGIEKRLNLTSFQSSFINPPFQQKNIKLEKISSEFQKKKLYKKKIVIIGNSHGVDFFESLLLSNYLNLKYDFKFIHVIRISCLKESIIKKNNVCERTFNINKFKFKDSLKELYNADILLIKFRLNPNELNDLHNVISFIKKIKETYIISTNPEFLISKNSFDKIRKGELENYSYLKKKLYVTSQIIDQFVIDYNQLPTNSKKMEEELFTLKKIRIYEENFFLYNYAIANNIKFFDLSDLFCDNIAKRCRILFQNNKIHKDDVGHLTYYGKKFLSNKLEENNFTGFLDQKN